MEKLQITLIGILALALAGIAAGLVCSFANSFTFLYLVLFFIAAAFAGLHGCMCCAICKKDWE